ncbi:hypothetical protein ACGFZL_30980 [Streptomyces sp. NPDC048182]|uniref:hypothetical protein n=1 Tax=Streptomyces sp. NPDC048182 TaxID=3365507 RepID=UPI00371687C8
MWWKRKVRKGSPTGAGPVELCDLCAAVFPESLAVRGWVPDSSAVHAGEDRFDGLRLVTACCYDHFDLIGEGYRYRPYVEEELWAAKLTRALTAGPPALSVEQLARRTGLLDAQIRAAIAWHNQRLREQPHTDP